MKIVATVSDGSGTHHLGTAVENKSCVLYIPDDTLPDILKSYFADHKQASEKPNCYCYKYLTLSLLEE